MGSSETSDGDDVEDGTGFELAGEGSGGGGGGNPSSTHFNNSDNHLGLVRSSRPFGKNKQLWGKGRWPWGCQVGPDWPCLIVTFALLWSPPVGVITIFSADAPLAVVALQMASLAVVTVSLCATAFSDGGILPKNERSIGSPPLPATDSATGRTLCTQCNVYRPRGAFHCRDCNCCVEELDHHCPWTGRCIGKNNLLMFKVYLGALVGHIVVFVIVTILLATARAAADMKRMRAAAGAGGG